jgi:hypothetical protein
MSEKSIPVIGLFDETGHLASAALEALRGGALCEDALTAALEHIGGCEKCAGAFDSCFAKAELAPVPAGFDEELQRKFEAIDKSRHSFALYVFKVAIAACVALIITFSSGFNAIVARQDKGAAIKAPSFSTVNAISVRLNAYSQNLVNMEAFNNAQKKK